MFIYKYIYKYTYTGDVHEEVFPLFEAIAQEMIKDMGAVQALCAAMAVACGHTKPLPAKSMLTVCIV